MPDRGWRRRAGRDRYDAAPTGRSDASIGDYNLSAVNCGLVLSFAGQQRNKLSCNTTAAHGSLRILGYTRSTPFFYYKNYLFSRNVQDQKEGDEESGYIGERVLEKPLAQH